MNPRPPSSDPSTASDPAALLPHAPPMVLLDGCAPGEAGEPVEAWVEVSPSSPFRERALGGVPGCVALEYMAQALALYVGRLREAAGKTPAIGFVLGTRRMEVSVPVFRDGVRYTVRAACAYLDESFGAFDCSIADPSGTVVASAQITAYQPEEASPSEIPA